MWIFILMAMLSLALLICVALLAIRALMRDVKPRGYKVAAYNVFTGRWSEQGSADRDPDVGGEPDDGPRQ